MKTATSLVVSIVVPTVLDERFLVHVAHGSVVEAGQDVADIVGRIIVRNAWRRGSPACLELAVEVFVYVDHCLVVSNMPKALVE